MWVRVSAWRWSVGAEGWVVGSMQHLPTHTSEPHARVPPHQQHYTTRTHTGQSSVTGFSPETKLAAAALPCRRDLEEGHTDLQPTSAWTVLQPRADSYSQYQHDRATA